MAATTAAGEMTPRFEERGQARRGAAPAPPHQEDDAKREVDERQRELAPVVLPGPILTRVDARMASSVARAIERDHGPPALRRGVARPLAPDVPRPGGTMARVTRPPPPSPVRPT